MISAFNDSSNSTKNYKPVFGMVIENSKHIYVSIRRSKERLNFVTSD